MMYISFLYNSKSCEFEEFVVDATPDKYEKLKQRQIAKGEDYQIVTLSTDSMRKLYFYCKDTKFDNLTRKENPAKLVRTNPIQTKIDNGDWRDNFR